MLWRTFLDRVLFILVDDSNAHADERHVGLRMKQLFNAMVMVVGLQQFDTKVEALRRELKVLMHSGGGAWCFPLTFLLLIPLPQSGLVSRGYVRQLPLCGQLFHLPLPSISESHCVVLIDLPCGQASFKLVDALLTEAVYFGIAGVCIPPTPLAQMRTRAHAHTRTRTSAQASC